MEVPSPRTFFYILLRENKGQCLGNKIMMSLAKKMVRGRHLMGLNSLNSGPAQTKRPSVGGKPPRRK